MLQKIDQKIIRLYVVLQLLENILFNAQDKAKITTLENRATFNIFNRSYIFMELSWITLLSQIIVDQMLLLPQLQLKRKANKIWPAGRQSRQLSEDSRSLGSIGYIAGSLGYHYEEASSHYPLWKPPGNYFPRGEAPPPYEEAVAAARAEAALAARTAPGTS